MDKQHTIKNKVSFSGVGLHTGKDTKIELLPAPEDTGIVFIRKDLESEVAIKASVDNVLDPQKYPRRTSIGVGEVHIYTIEHLLGALHILGIDNLFIHIWGYEVPGMDGSAQQFIATIKDNGLQEQSQPRQYIKISKPVNFSQGRSSIVVLPAPQMRISYTLQYDNPLIDTEFLDFAIDDNELADKISQARTFCLKEEVESLLEMGLGQGSNYQNTLVVSRDDIVENKMRVSEEFVKHKVLDLLGDLYLCGPIKAHIIALRSGHQLNCQAIQKIASYRQQKNNPLASMANRVNLEGELGVEAIKQILPHRYPFLLVDRILDIQPGKKIIGIKNVTVNDYFFQGHFPVKPVMPGVLIIEAMAQVGGVLMLAKEQNKGKLAYFMAVDKAKFRKTVEPGDQLVIEVEAQKIRTRAGVVSAKAFVGEDLVTQAELKFALADI
jgi:UDP-3-O-[3-hydroxymyristoyl] N-acetylglucosamine deacetylase/3-hydroxyacyl-[acyl-carrier-protein] dehydratase